jgi:hypothetical protein
VTRAYLLVLPTASVRSGSEGTSTLPRITHQRASLSHGGPLLFGGLEPGGLDLLGMVLGQERQEARPYAGDVASPIARSEAAE